LDFGFARFLEIFEQRFGKAPTTALLVLIGLAVAAVCLQLIVDNVLKPVLGLFGGMSPTEINRYIRDTVLPLLLSLLAVYFLSSFLVALVDKVVRRRTIDKEVARIKSDLDKHAEQAFSETLVRSYDFLHKLRDLSREEAKRFFDEASAILQAEATAKSDELLRQIEKTNTAVDETNATVTKLQRLLAQMEETPETAQETLRRFLRGE